MAKSIRYLKNNHFFKPHPFFLVIHILFLRPFFNYLYPSSLTSLISRTHDVVKKNIDHRTTHKALEALYDGDHPGHVDTPLKKVFYSLWMNSLNALGVRNRLSVVTREVTRDLQDKFERKPETVRHVLCLASGSGRSIIESLKILLENNAMTGPLTITFLDRDPEALRFCKAYFQEALPSTPENLKCFWIEQDIDHFLALSGKKEHYDLVEMIGFLDYMPDSEIPPLLNRVYRILNPEDGLLICANILHNPEERTINRVFKWGLIHRDPEGFLKLLRDSRFGSEGDLQVLVEPLRVHAIALSRRKQPY